jgi:4-amino-4-deoxy-L-arabinose transferase-like glycosyltransferase
VFFALASVYLTDRSRAGLHTGTVSLAAGAAAGLACASKYPAMLVILVFPAATALFPLPWREKLRHLSFAAAGVVAGVVVGMPIALVRAAEILKAARYLQSTYESWAAPYLLDQAFVRAEWDLDFARPELGATFALLALGGLVVGLRRRESRAIFFGISVFAAASIAFVSLRSFQPFRNVLALVPLACVAIGLAFARVRARLRRPLVADALLAAWLLGVYALPLAAYTRSRVALADPRRLTLDWVAQHAEARDRVLLVRDAEFLNQELERFGGRASAAWFDSLPAEAQRTAPRFLIVGSLSRPGAEPEDLAASPSIRAAYVERYCVGTSATPADPERWRGNDQRLCVLERR